MVQCFGLRGYQIVLAAGMLLTGSINTLVKKLQNECFSTGLTDMGGNKYHVFDHPWFQTWIMFIGESLCFWVFLSQRIRAKKTNKHKELKDPFGPQSENDKEKAPRLIQPIILLPTICDIFGTTLSGIGLLYVDASVWQMLRGSIIVFTGLFSRFFLKRHLFVSQWIGILITMTGLCLVGLSSVLEAHHNVSKWHTILGVILIVGSQVVSATQMVIEEIFLKKRKLEPLHVVGTEGLYGFFLMSVVILPIVYFIPGDQHHKSYENSIDAFIMLKNNYLLAVYCVLYLLSIAFYNYFGLSVTRSLTAVHRTLLDACRTMVVWVVSLFIYYAINHRYGEKWNSSYGIIQVDGFLLLLIGTGMYNQLFDFSWLCKRQDMSSTYPEIQAPDYQSHDAISDGESERDGLLGNSGGYRNTKGSYNAI